MWFHLPLPFHLEFFTNLGSRRLSKVAHLQNRKTQWGGPGHEGCERAGPGSRTPCKPPCGGRPLREGHREGLEISKKGSAMMWFMLWAAHSYTLPMPEAGRKLVGCDSDLGKRWRGCRIGGARVSRPRYRVGHPDVKGSGSSLLVSVCIQGFHWRTL